MNLELVKKIADAVLYEGYMLYPYRASAVKNRQRFNWGVLTPQSYSEAQRGTERWQMQTEVLVTGNEPVEIDVKLRFLHLCEREIYRFDESTFEFYPVQSMEAGGKIYQTWQEAVEREECVSVTIAPRAAETSPPVRSDFTYPASEETEYLFGEKGGVAGKIVRRQEEITGRIEVQRSSEKFREVQKSNPFFKLTVLISNTTPFSKADWKNRDEALAHSLVSAHTVLLAQKGEFISLLEPSEEFVESAARCTNIGTYPVLVGEKGHERDCFLSSPIILYDYPEIAPESAGDLFDGAEIDEILTLRIMTMTDEEKREMQNIDERAGKLLERTENLTAEQLMQMHGVLRQPRAFGNNEDFFKDDPDEKKKAAPG